MTESATKRERIFSGIQPSGEIHIGNYLGAIRNWASLLDGYDCIFCVVDYHALTAPTAGPDMPERAFEAVVANMACGIDPERATLFVQSHVPDHAELCWLFNTVSPLGSLFRMTQFKDKSRGALRHRVESAQATKKEIAQVARQLSKLSRGVQDRMKPLEDARSHLVGGTRDEVLEAVRQANDRLGEMMQFLQVGLGVSEAGMALLDYPVLQAADVLLYKATKVPVGEDQDQHIELCREIADRFNKRVGREVFPQAHVLRSPTPRVMGVDGRAKMSKSLDNHIGVLWEPDQIWERLQGAFTDPQRLRRDDPGRPEVCNIFTIHKALTDEAKVRELDQDCRSAGIGCVDCKKALLESLTREFAPAREKAAELRAHPEVVRDALRAGARRCRTIAAETLAEAREAIGLRGGLCDIP